MKNARILPIPAKYGFDDTPKAFTRMMQRKEAMGDFKRVKSDGPIVSSTNTNISSLKRSPSPLNIPRIGSTSASKASVSSGFKTIRSKRKAHLQTRDLKKKLKKFDSQNEHFLPQSTVARDVRDVVQEPPKLLQPKKTFKKIKEEREMLRSWSDLEDEDLEAN